MLHVLTAVYQFRVDGLLISPELIDARTTLTFESHNMAFAIPSAADVSNDPDEHNVKLPDVIGLRPQGHDFLLHAFSVPVIRVEVEVDNERLSESDDARIAILRDNLELARRFAESYVALARTRLGQYWLGASAERLRLWGLSKLRDSQGRTVPLDDGRNGASPLELDVRHEHERTVADVEHLSELSLVTWQRHAFLLKDVIDEAVPALPEVFLSDARYAALRVGGSDLRQAVLLAAVACETKVKTVITTLATEEKQSLVTLLLENPRDWSMSAVSLFDKGLKAICGRSLREEDKNLYKQIDMLFQDRNKIAHRGSAGISSPEALRGYVAAATAAFNWLDELLAQDGTQPTAP
jgi:hypothetical protein